MTDLEKLAEHMLEKGNTTAHVMHDVVGNLAPLTMEFAARYSPSQIIKLARNSFLIHACAIFEVDTIEDTPNPSGTTFRTDERGRLIPKPGTPEIGDVTFDDFQLIFDELSKREEITWKDLQKLLAPYFAKIRTLRQKRFFN